MLDMLIYEVRDYSYAASWDEASIAKFILQDVFK